MKERKYDAALVRLYWLSQRGDDGIVKPSLRTRFADRAAYLLYRNGIVKNFVLAAGYMWGPEYPSFADVAKKDLMRYGIPENIIHVRPTAASTWGETKAVLEVAAENKWNSLADICFRRHGYTIKHVNRGHNIDVINVEDVLKTDDRRVAELVQRFTQLRSLSRYEWGFLFYEWIAWGGLKLVRGNYERLTEWARSKRNKKGHNLPWGYIGLSMDKYKL